jgi:hypothetical protein
MSYSFDKNAEFTITAMANDTFKQVEVYENKLKAKPGFDFGTDNGKKITEKKVNHTIEMIYTDSNHISETKSYMVDGKDQGPTPGRYLSEETREGDTLTTKDSLMEPVADPGDKNAKITSDVDTCNIKQVTLN